MSDIKIKIFHTGEVGVAPFLPFGGDNCSALKASVVLSKKSKRLWLPVSAYLIEYDGKKILFDCGWHRNMSPDGVFDKKAQIKSLGSRALYKINQGKLPKGQAINKQLEAIGVRSTDIDVVFLSHLDCDHINGLSLMKDAKQILVSKEELAFATKKSYVNRIRYNSDWWNDTKIKNFAWNSEEGPVGHSYDVFGDGHLKMIHIPGHSDGLCALKITNNSGKYVLLFSDGGYAAKSWQEQITSGIATDKELQKKSLIWIREQSLSHECVESVANHDPDIKPHVISF